MAVGLVAAPLAFADVNKGKALFNNAEKAQCSVCHAFGEEVIGPSLAATGKLHTKPWLVGWITNPSKTWAGKDAETVGMKKRLKKTKAPAPEHNPPPLTPEQAGDIADFLLTK